jgi:hypothetical protein
MPSSLPDRADRGIKEQVSNPLIKKRLSRPVGLCDLLDQMQLDWNCSLWNGSQIGMLRAALIESAVTAATRQSENALSASDATTASISRVDATGALPPLNPVAPYDRVMVRVLGTRESPAQRQRDRNSDRLYWGRSAARWPQALTTVNDWGVIRKSRIAR